MANAQSLRILGNGQASQVPLRIHIEVAKLDEIGMVCSDQVAQGGKFLGGVGKPRENKVIEGYKTAIFLHDIDGFHDIRKSIIFRPIIGVVVFLLGRIEAHSKAVQSDLCKSFDIERQTRV